jgi:hypothetical protein
MILRVLDFTLLALIMLASRASATVGDGPRRFARAVGSQNVFTADANFDFAHFRHYHDDEAIPCDSHRITGYLGFPLSPGTSS